MTFAAFLDNEGASMVEPGLIDPTLPVVALRGQGDTNVSLSLLRQ